MTGPAPTGPALTRTTLLLIAATVGLCAGSNYFNQPLLESIASALHVSDAAAGATVTVVQAAYAVGLMLIVPAGDTVARRRLVVILLAVTIVGLALCGFAGTFSVFIAGLVLSGLCSVAAQVLVPFVASMAAPEDRGAMTGTVMSGLLIGILVARAISGILSELGGWQTVYLVAAALMLLALIAMRLILPPGTPAPNHPTYAQALRSLVPLLRTYPRLATRTVLGALAFAGASLVFATMALLLTRPPFGLDNLGVGLVGLVGVAGAVAAGFVGRGVDRGVEVRMGAICLIVLAIAWIDFATFGATNLVAFVIAMILLDLGLQGIHVANQGVIQRLDDRARSRITSVYMTGYFIGAAAGSALAVLAWSINGWPTVCIVGFGLLILTAAAWWGDLMVARRLRSPHTASATSPTGTAQ